MSIFDNKYSNPFKQPENPKGFSGNGPQGYGEYDMNGNFTPANKVQQTPQPTVQGNTLSGGLGVGLSPTAPNSTPQGTGSLVDFQKVMRAIGQNAYESRKKGELKINKGQFDATKVSGSLFKNIIDFAESGRGGDISKMYSSGIDAYKFDAELKEKQRQFDVEQDNKKWSVIKDKIDAGVDSIYIPGGTLADKNNNPGNLRYVGQEGATMGEGGFAKFNTPEAGWQALISQIQLDQSRGLTLAQFVSKYAPPTENNTNLYVQQMASWLGVSSEMKLADIDYDKVAEMIAKKESGAQVIKASGTSSDVEAMARKYKSGELTAAQIPAAQRGKVMELASTLGQVVSPEQKAVLMNNVQITDRILGNYKAISGIAGGMFAIPFTEGWKTSNEYAQLKGLLSLDKRQLLKGQGAISDYEFKILSEAASSINRLSSEEDFRKELVRIRGAFTTAAGEKAQVKVSKGSDSKTGFLTRDEITSAIAQGYIVDYV